MTRREELEVDRIDPEFVNLIDKLNISKNMYYNASDRLTDELLKEKMNQMGFRKEVYIKEIAHLFESNHEDIDEELTKRIEVELDKMDLEIEHLILNKSEAELMNYLLDHEHEVIQIYNEILNDDSYSDLENTVVKSQKNENRQNIEELKKMKDSYSEEN